MNKIVKTKDGQDFVVTDRKTLLDIVSFVGGMELKDAVKEELDNDEEKTALVVACLKDLLKHIYRSDVSDEVWMAAVNADIILKRVGG